jgi:methylmalonyl-CoA/ethylmalonyl-CoA epimerase
MTDALTIDGMHQVALTTAEVHRSTEFYRDVLGLKLMAVFDPPGLAFFDVDGVRLSVMQNENAEPSDSVIYFRVADIDAAIELLKQKSVKLEQEPEMVFRDEKGQFGEAGEEEWMAFFRDPDGNLLALACRKKV